MYKIKQLEWSHVSKGSYQAITNIGTYTFSSQLGRCWVDTVFGRIHDASAENLDAAKSACSIVHQQLVSELIEPAEPQVEIYKIV